MTTINKVRLVISKPMVSKSPAEKDYDMTQVAHARNVIVSRAQKAWGIVAGREPIEGNLTPGEKQCEWCKAKAQCPEYAKTVAEVVTGTADGLGNFTLPVTPEAIANAYKLLGLVRSWCDGIEAQATSMGKAGIIGEAHGLKMVAGRQGNREWVDPDAVEAEMKSMRLKQDEMYSYTLISPTVAEELLKESPRKWKRLADRIARKDGAPKLVPLSDKRPAVDYRPNADGFDSVEPEQQAAVVQDDADDLC